jgi:hypothetical protein
VLVDKHSTGREWSKIEQIVGGQVFSLWRMVQVDSLLTCHGPIFS